MKMGQEAQKQEQKKQLEEVVRVIDSIGEDFKLSSWGYTSRLKITKGDQVEYVKLRIKSVGVADVIEQTQKGIPRPPSQMKAYKRGSAEANALGSKHDIVVREIDEANPDYLNLLEEHNRKSGQIIVLSGLAYDLTWDGRIVLEGSDFNNANRIIDQDAAIKALRRIGISGAHYSQILKDVRGLTEDVEEETLGE